MIIFSVFIFILFIGSIVYVPVLFLSLSSLILMSFKVRPVYYQATVATLIALFCMAINGTGQTIGDVTRYYQGFEDFSYWYALIDYKLFRFIAFYLLDLFNAPIKAYTFICILLVSLLYQIYFDKFCKSFLPYQREDFIFRFIKLIFIISVVPLSVSLSFENVLSFVFFFCFIVENKIEKRKKIACFFLLLSFITHFSSFLLYFILLIVIVCDRFNMKYAFSCFWVVFSMVFLYFISFINAKTGLFVVDFFIEKSNYYLFGPWSIFIGIGEYYMLFIAIVKIAISGFCTSYFYKNSKGSFESYLFKFLLLFLIFTSLFLLSRSLVYRYVYLGFVLFAPVIYCYIRSANIKLGRRRGLTVLYILTLFSSPNIFYVISIKDREIKPDYFYLSSIVDIFEYEFVLPDGLEKLKSRTEKVEEIE
ncbi:hypothetical protein CWB96_11100 [Pseudoalteromonas citrea]|uniref:EpsG family protein n=1 Tax=Pseudoalteromonas citrea TaxID=43655 RepID=A0A5S3XPC6_9GAMM|nr:hypothetical protein [Pseudoalteromonas citrea]TMP45724.1 hypothetical protein CWB97_03745 [Pseudoalteromonas citrea]TMP59103.1 hypothetical protein CWB96_11100 [Pseudoalteromonas citrea]